MAFKLNMSDDVAQSSAEYELPPTGMYVVNIADVTSEEVKQGDNMGKPFWRLKLVIDEGQYAGLPVIHNIMLFGKPFSLKWLCDAVHPEFIEGDSINLPTAENGMPDPSPFIGQKCVMKATKHAAGSRRSSGKNKGQVRERDELDVLLRKLDSKKEQVGNGVPLPS